MIKLNDLILENFDKLWIERSKIRKSNSDRLKKLRDEIKQNPNKLFHLRNENKSI